MWWVTTRRTHSLENTFVHLLTTYGTADKRSFGVEFFYQFGGVFAAVVDTNSSDVPGLGVRDHTVIGLWYFSQRNRRKNKVSFTLG